MKSIDIPSRILPFDYTVLEVGVGSSPFPPDPTVLGDLITGRNKHWDFSGGRTYLGVDSGEGSNEPGFKAYYADPITALQETEENMRQIRPNENISFLLDNAITPTTKELSKLDLGGVDEVLLFNVLSSRINAGMQQRLLERSREYLKKGGLLVVRETFTPQHHSSELLVVKLGRIAFDDIEVITESDEGFSELTEYYGPTIHDKAAEPYPSGDSLPELDSIELIPPEENYAYLFSEIGTYNYYEYSNPTEIKGTIIVE